MFFYISFLRPPPLQATPFGTIPITPQIANDLRTEPFPNSQDIFYSWSQSSSVHETTTKPTKLTTWRQATAYKEIPVPVPPGVRAGQAWRLLLSTQPASGSTTIDLGDAALGHAPFPVLSMPITFGPRAGKGKQEQVERVYQLRAPARADEEVPGLTVALRLRITEQTSFDLDKKVWDSGVGLSSWLVGLHASSGGETQTGLKDALFSPEPRNILELGAGTGIVALTLAALRSNTSPSPSTASENASIASGRIITTDLESAMPLLAHNISSNASLFSPTGTVPLPEARVLDWDDETLPDYIQITGGFDAIVMADVTYNTASFPSLVRTLSALTHLGPKPPLFLLGYKERDPAERTLWDLARAAVAGLEFAKIGERRGAGGAPVEVWLGQIRPP